MMAIDKAVTVDCSPALYSCSGRNYDKNKILSTLLTEWRHRIIKSKIYGSGVFAVIGSNRWRHPANSVYIINV